MKKLAFAALTLCCVWAMSNNAEAQYYQNNDPMAQMNQLMNSMGDPMAGLQRLQQMNEQRMAMLKQNHARYQRQAINDYRKQTNDYTSPDHIILQRSMAESRRRNPELYRIAEANHRRRMADQQNNFRTHQMIHQNNQQILDMGMQGHMNRMASSDRIHRMQVNSIWGRSDFHDPNTGQVFNLQNDVNNVWQWDNNNTFFGDQTGTQWRHDGNGFWNELEEIR